MNIQEDLLQYYVFKKIIRRKDVEEILENSAQLKSSVREYMLLKEYTTDVVELEALATYYSMPFIEVDMLDIDKDLFDKFSFTFMRKYKIIPVCITPNNTLIVVSAKPLDCNTRSAMNIYHNGPVDVILSPSTQIDRYIDSVDAVISTSAALSDLNSERDKKIFEDAADNVDVSVMENEDVINNPSVRLVDSIIKEAIPYRASDIHIEPFEKKVRVRYRIDGDLQERAEFPIESYPPICARLKIMSGMNIAEHRIPQDGRINMVVGGKEYDFRVSSLPTVNGEKIVIRILDKTSFSFTRTDLGFTEQENEVIDKILARPNGIILLTGPTGCGKSTTLYSFLKEINTPNVNIVTVEDPVEYTMAGINQTQVNTKAEMTFAAALRSILRQDPDVIMIGEIRDSETAEIAVRASITGHKVFSTLHTNDAPGAVTRLEDMGIEDYLVCDALTGVIAQRLVKRLCPACKKRSKTNAKETEILGLNEPISIFRPVGCQFCNNTGYKGRAGIHEIMYLNEEMKAVVGRERNLEELRRQAAENGMHTLFESCRELVIKGVTSIQELNALSVE